MSDDWQVVEEALPPAEHDPPCGIGRCAPHTSLARLREREAQLHERNVRLETQELSDALNVRDTALEAAEARVARLEEALRWCLEHRDSERFFSVGESALAHEEEKVRPPAPDPALVSWNERRVAHEEEKP